MIRRISISRELLFVWIYRNRLLFSTNENAAGRPAALEEILSLGGPLLFTGLVAGFLPQERKSRPLEAAQNGGRDFDSLL